MFPAARVLQWPARWGWTPFRRDRFLLTEYLRVTPTSYYEHLPSASSYRGASSASSPARLWNAPRVTLTPKPQLVVLLSFTSYSKQSMSYVLALQDEWTALLELRCFTLRCSAMVCLSPLAKEPGIPTLAQEAEGGTKRQARPGQAALPTSLYL